MDKLTAIKIKYDDGTYSDEIPVSVLSENVEWDSTHTLVDVLGSIDIDVAGTIQDQISQLFNEKVSASELNNYVANQLKTDVTDWLSTNVDPVGSAVIVDSSLTIQGAAADAKVVGNLKSDIFDVYDSSASGNATPGGNLWVQYKINAGHTYHYTNTSAVSGQTAHTVQAAGSYDYTEQIGTGVILHGQTVVFTAMSDAPYIVIYCNGKGSYHISAELSLSELDTKIDNLGTELTTAENVIDSNRNTISNVFKQELNEVVSESGNQWYAYPFIPGHVYELKNMTKDGSARISAQTTNGINYTWIEQITPSITIQPAANVIFIPAISATHLHIYCNAACAFSISDISTTYHNYAEINNLKIANDNENAFANTIVQSVTDKRLYIPLYFSWENQAFNLSTGADLSNTCCASTSTWIGRGNVRLKCTALNSINSCALMEYNESMVYHRSWGITTTGTFLTLVDGHRYRLFIYGTRANAVDINNIDSYISVELVNDNTDTLPEYYSAYMDSKISEIITKSAYVQGITFPFITDVHLGYNALNSGKMIKYIDKKTNAVPFVIFGGDVPMATGTPEEVYGYADQWNKYMDWWGKHKTIQVHGNHDYMCALTETSELWFAPLSKVFEYVQQNDLFYLDHPAGALYGSLNLPGQEIKIVIADNYDGSYNIANDSWTSGATMSNAQLKWIAQDILNAQGYHVLFVTHVPTLPSMSVPHEAQALAPFDNLIKAARNKTTYTVDGETFDFTSWSGEVIAELAGHMHKDANGTSDNVLYIGTTCDSYSVIEATRTVGTVSEQAFDVVCIDITNKIIRTVRVGGGNDRAWNYETGEELA